MSEKFTISQNNYAGLNNSTIINKNPDDIPIDKPQDYQINQNEILNKNIKTTTENLNEENEEDENICTAKKKSKDLDFNFENKQKLNSKSNKNLKEAYATAGFENSNGDFDCNLKTENFAEQSLFNDLDSQKNKVLKYERYEESLNDELQEKATKPKVKWYEALFLICNIVVVIAIFVFSKEKNVLSFACSFIGCFSIWLLAKGMYFAPIFNTIYDILYIILSYTQNYFGEAIIYLCMTLPIDLYSIFAWRKNRSESSSVISFNKLSTKELLLFSLGTGVLTVVFFFILRALNTSQLLISTISFIPSAMAAYFLLRRSNLYSFAYTLNDVVLITLWTISLVQYGTAYLSVVINFVCIFCIDFYGFINLKKELKKQELNLELQSSQIN